MLEISILFCEYGENVGFNEAVGGLSFLYY